MSRGRFHRSGWGIQVAPGGLGGALSGYRCANRTYVLRGLRMLLAGLREAFAGLREANRRRVWKDSQRCESDRRPARSKCTAA